MQDLWNNDREQLRQVRDQLAQLRADLATSEKARLTEDRLKFEALAELDDVRAELHEAESRLASIGNCGQETVCATPPGCMRHWEMRNRELLGELNSSRAKYDLYRARAETMVQSLRADLVTVTAERDRERDWRIDKERLLVNEERAHAETRKALEALNADYGTLLGESNAHEIALESVRANIRTEWDLWRADKKNAYAALVSIGSLLRDE